MAGYGLSDRSTYVLGKLAEHALLAFDFLLNDVFERIVAMIHHFEILFFDKGLLLWYL